MNRPTIGVFSLQRTAAGRLKKVVITGHYSGAGALVSARRYNEVNSWLPRRTWIEAARAPATLPGTCDLRPARIR
jgi:hypothetical protein